jgi:hypothetical protein
MDYIVRTIVENFFGFVIGEERWLDVPNLRFPEVIHINGSLGDAAAGYLTPE